MASTNKAETYQTEDVFKCRLNGASSLGCCGCDARAYAQANCWKAFCPPFPTCKACLEKGEDHTLQQFRFCNPYFLQPIFHNNSVCQSYCCPHGGFNMKPGSRPDTGARVNHECDQMGGLETSHTFCQKMEKKTKGDKISEKNISENESSHTQFPCNWGESFPWASNPFIIPVVSYCVLWNPQSLNDNCSNYACGQMENLNNKNEDPVNDLFPNNKNNEKYDKDLDVLNKCDQDAFEDDTSKKKTDGEHNHSSSSFLSIHSSSHDENKSYNVKKKSSSISDNADSEDNSEEEETGEQVANSESSGNVQPHLSAESSKNLYSNNDDYCEVYSIENENQQLSSEESETNLKATNFSAEAKDEEADEFSDEKSVHVSQKNSLASLYGKSEEFNNVEIGSCGKKSKTTSKNLIKSFTVTSRTENAFEGKPKVSGAGGDLGGTNCTGFKVNIESEEMQLESMQQGITKRNFESKRNLLKGFEGKKPNNFPDKTESKWLRTSKTGIAKLIPDSKPKDTNSDVTKNVKRENKESDNKDIKRRCFANDSHVREDTSKFLKDKNLKMARHHKTGQEKENSSLNLNNKLSKKEEKFSAPKVRSHNCDWNSRK